VENLHWIDPTSEALLTSLVEGLAGASILVLVTFRPGYHPLWLDKSYATQFALQPLGLNEAFRWYVACYAIHLSPRPEQQLRQGGGQSVLPGGTGLHVARAGRAGLSADDL
jgi:hypothetical protein